MKKLITISSPQFKTSPISFYCFLTTSPKNAISLANNPHYFPKEARPLHQRFWAIWHRKLSTTSPSNCFHWCSIWAKDLAGGGSRCGEAEGTLNHEWSSHQNDLWGYIYLESVHLIIIPLPSENSSLNTSMREDPASHTCACDHTFDQSILCVAIHRVYASHDVVNIFLKCRPLLIICE